MNLKYLKLFNLNKVFFIQIYKSETKEIRKKVLDKNVFNVLFFYFLFINSFLSK
jgi:hypothetical protein